MEQLAKKLSRVVLALFALTAIGACGQEDSVEQDAALDPLAGIPHRAMFDAVLADLRETGKLDEGNWQNDFGDGSFYGPAFDYAYGKATGDSFHVDRALATADYVIREIEQSENDISYLIDHLDDTSMGVMGLIEIARMGADAKYQAAAASMLEKGNGIAKAFQYYVDGEIDNYATNTYGPTAITALLALMNFQYVLNLEDEKNDEYVQVGLDILEVIDERAWDPALKGYRYAEHDEKLYLYPNVVMMLTLNRAYELTGRQEFLDRAASLFDAIQPLRDLEQDAYFTRYSAEIMGAEGEDYHSLSPHNYLAFALTITYQNTKDKKFLDEAMAVIDFVETYLLVEGRALHHWMNGRVAIPSDYEYYCPACNLQLLYLLWYLRDVS
jgi:hypothetical protein